MLDKLPPELIDHVLVLACPSTAWPDRLSCDRERHHTLFAASLVSKRIKERAQALLWRDVVIETDKEVEVLTVFVKREEPKGLMAKTRLLGGSERNEIPPLTALASGSPQLKEVQFVQWGAFVPTDFRHLAEQYCTPFPNLNIPHPI
jgi:hypothetical protein